jgi:integrase
VARTAGTFGTITELSSGRLRARYTGPDGVRHTGPATFDTKGDARKWLATVHADIIRNQWNPPKDAPARRAPVTVAHYAARWVQQRDLKPRTRDHYGMLLERHILPVFGDKAITAVTSDDVRAWHASEHWAKPGTATINATLRSHAYGLLRALFTTATADGVVPLNPCTIRGAGSTQRVHKVRPATLDELATVVEAMPERLRAMVLLASWTALRFGELTELRRRDLDLAAGVVRVRRGVVRVAGETVVGSPKSDAGTRDVALPPHLTPALVEHLERHVEGGPDALLFPADHGGHLAPSTLYRRFYAARAKAGRPDLRFHDLRHSGAVLAALTGATLSELMGRLGHSTPAAALRYQHIAQGRDAQIAAALSALVNGA